MPAKVNFHNILCIERRFGSGIKFKREGQGRREATRISTAPRQSAKGPMKWGILSTFTVLIIILVLWGKLGIALEPPSLGELEKYREDGSLSARIEYAMGLGNHRISTDLFARFTYNLNRFFLESQGVKPKEIDAILAPPPAWQGMPTKGTVKVLALLIAFSDYAPSNTAESIRSKLFGDGVDSPPYDSLRNYYRRSSYNQLEIQGNVLGWYTTAYSRSSVSQTTAGRENLIKQALNYYNSIGHDFSQYDNDGNGTIDYLIVIWTGPDNGWANFWWGYMTNFTDSSFSLDGKRIDTYSWQWEARPSGGVFMPLVVMHETGHALGLPDYYDYDGTVGPDGGVGGLDMMDSNWGDHNCFSKFLLDWINPVTYNSGNHSIALHPSGTTQDAVVVMPDALPGNQFGEFFMIQNRYRVANDTGYPNDGLLIWHVDARLNTSGTDFVYDNSYTSHKLLRLMEADGLEEIETGDGRADAGDYYVSGKTFGPSTIPNSNRYGGSATGVLVNNIWPSGDMMNFTASLPGSSEPEINVKQDGMSIPDNTGSYDFGSSIPGTSRAVTFIIENVGTAPLNLTGVPKVEIGGIDSGDFLVTNEPSTPVPAGGSTEFVITFTPAASGFRSAAVSIANDDSNENPYNFAVSGTGIPCTRIVSMPLDAKGAPGQTDISIPINITDASGFAGGDFTVAFDPAMLTLKDVQLTSLTSGFSLAMNAGTPGVAAIALAQAAGIGSGSGALVNLIFDVSSSTSPGATSPLTFQSVSLFDENAQSICSTAENGVLTVEEECHKADVNHDYSINSADGILVLRIAAGLLTPDSYQSCAADANCDGAMNSGDAILTLRAAALLPTIFCLSPNSGMPGTSVTIKGWNLGDIQGSSVVKFSGVVATGVTRWAKDRILVNVPSGTTTGLVTVTVGGVASNGVSFTIGASPPVFSAREGVGGVVVRLPEGIGGFPGKTGVAVPITIEGKGVAGADMVLTFDDTMLEATGVELGGVGEGFSLLSNIIPGRVQIAMASGRGMESNRGVLARVIFRVSLEVAVGTAIPLSLENVSLFDEEARELKAVTQDGWVLAGHCLSGRITDGKTGDPLSTVKVYFQDRFGTDIVVAVTDEEGRYSECGFTPETTPVLKVLVKPSADGHKFSPRKRNVSIVDHDLTDINFKAKSARR